MKLVDTIAEAAGDVPRHARRRLGWLFYYAVSLLVMAVLVLIGWLK